MHLFELRVLCGYMLRSVTSLVAQLVYLAELTSAPPAMSETPVRFLRREDPLAKG